MEQFEAMLSNLGGPLADPAMRQRAIYAAMIPVAVAVVLCLLPLPWACRRKGCWRPATWCVPLAAAAGVALAFFQPLHEVVEPSSLGWGGARTKWLLPALASVLLLWPVLLMPWPTARGKRWFWAGWAALVIAAGAGLFVGWTRYDLQSTNYLWLAPVASLIGAVLLYPPAVANAGRGDLWVMSAAGFFAMPVLWLTEWQGAAVVASPAVFATITATVIAAIFTGARFAEYRHGLAAGAMILPVALACVAVVAWFNATDLKPVYAIALSLAPVGAVLAVWAFRLPRAMPVVFAAAAAILGFALAVTQSDLRAYFPERYSTDESYDAYAEPSDEAPKTYNYGD